MRSKVLGSVLTVLALGVGFAAVPAAADPSGGAAARQWQLTADQAPRYPGVAIEWDVPITMSDGTVLRANVYRPADAVGRAIEDKLPTVLNITPYTKLISAVADAGLALPGVEATLVSFLNQLNLTGTPLDGVTELTGLVTSGGMKAFGVNRALVQSGYTQVVVDARGTGFSQGVWDVLGPREQQDSVEIIDWASRQPWSDGAVGMGGVSYSGINSVQAAGHRPPALKAIFPVEPGNDLLRDIVGTGGGLGVGFMPMWLALVDGLKLVPNAQDVLRGTVDQRWLADRLADPFTMIPELVQAVSEPDIADMTPSTMAVAQDGPFYQDRRADLDRIEVPTMVFGGWHDIFANSEPRIYNGIDLPPGRKQLVMGDTYHLNPGQGFGTAGSPPRIDVLERAWFDRWLKGIDNGIEKYGPVTLWQQGGGWTTTDRFPRAGAQYQRLYLSAAPSGTAGHSGHDGSLTTQAPGEAARLTVAPGARGLCSRDAAQGTAGMLVVLGSVCTKDSRIQEAEGLTFTGAPVTEPTVISGPINVHLNTVHDTTDGFWAVTVNDVAPDGRSTVLTSGALTSSLRAVDDARSEKAPNGDYTDAHHRLTLATRQPTVPGQPTVLDVNMVPTDAVLAPGHRLRVDVYALSVPRYLPLGPMLAASGLRPQHLQLDPTQPSYVTFPTVG
ncbi:CocE/NonD family hydrolase [Rhodococcus sp. NPDC058505]|uniref:CocE/NonD family hydrolase n=1 Tax=Rhodococcus sp. NPDC058505 TaxID=3346531 RepID=UPI0036469F55